MSQADKEVQSKQADSKDANIANMINQVIDMLDNVKKKAQQLFDQKCPASVKSSMKQALSATASTLNKTKQCAKAKLDKKAADKIAVSKDKQKDSE